jgi:hypothetical protein
MIFDRRCFVGMIAAVFVAEQSFAESHEPVILTVTGLEEVAEYRLSDLEALGLWTVETSTIWSDGVQDFVGVSLLALLQDLGVTEGAFMARAINDYAVEVPVSDAVENGPIIAHHRNGEPMSIRDKGPLWLIYPYDQNAEYRSEVIYSRSIWQLDRIEILP